MGEGTGGRDGRSRAVVRWPEDDGGARLPRGARLPVGGLALDVAVAGVVLALALLVSSFLAWLTALPLVVWAVPRLVSRLMRRRLLAHGLGRLVDVRLTEVTALAAGVFVVAVVGVVSGPPADVVSRVTDHDPTAEVVGTFLVAVVLAPVCWAVAFGWAACRALRRRLDELVAWQGVLDGGAPADAGGLGATPVDMGARDAAPVWRPGSEAGVVLAGLASRAGPASGGSSRRGSPATSVALGAVGFVLVAVAAWVAAVAALIVGVFWVAGG